MKKMITILAAAVMTTALASTASAWGTSYKVQIGTLAAGAGPQELTASSTTAIVWRFGSATMTCLRASVQTASVSRSTVTNSPTTNVLNLMTFGEVSFFDCKLGSTAMTVRQLTPFTLHAVGGASNATYDTVYGHLSALSFEMKDASTGGFVCRFNVSGDADSTYKEDTRVLTVNEVGSVHDLFADNVMGCGGSIASHSWTELTGSFRTRAAWQDYTVNIKP